MDIAMLEEVPPRESLDSFTLSRHTSTTFFRRTSTQVVGVESESLCHKSHWVPKSTRSRCSNCKHAFRVYNAKHNCRLCGEVVCGPCSSRRMLFQKKSVRACDECVDNSLLAMPQLQRSSSTSSHSSSSATSQRQRTSSARSMLPIPNLSRTTSNSSTGSNTSNSSLGSSVGGQITPYDPSSSDDMAAQTPKRKSDSDLMKLAMRKSGAAHPRPRRHTHTIALRAPLASNELHSVAHLSPIEGWCLEGPVFVMVLVMMLATILYLQSLQ